MNKTTKTTKKKNTGTRGNRKLTILLIAVLITGILAGGLLAKYRSDNQKQAEMIAAQFHVSSDYLTEDASGPTYNITDWQNGFDIHLYNYEKENTALISEDDITYEVELSDTSKWTSDPQNKTTATIKKSNERQSQTIRIIPQSTVSENDSVTVTIKISQPFTKTLSATFKMRGKNEPDYSIEDQNDGTVLVTIQSNSYSGNMEITWNQDKYAPDNTNPQMETWNSSPQIFSIQKNTTYELLFFKKSVESTSGTSGSGTTISLS